MSYQQLPTSNQQYHNQQQQYQQSQHQSFQQQPALRLGTVRNNNPLNPFSSNTTNPKQWGPTKTSLAQNNNKLNATRDFIEMLSFSYFFSGIYYACLFALLLVKGHTTYLTFFVLFLLLASVTGIAAICYKRCAIWYEYGALEYYQPIKDLLRAGIKKKGLWSLGSGLLILAFVVVYGPFMVGAVAYVDELGQREHRD